MIAHTYLNRIKEIANRIETTQMPVMQRVSERIAESIGQDGVLHLFGSGHSHMIAEDTFHRAGGLACINAMLEPSLMEINVGRATRLERLNGYAEVLLSGYDLRPGEVIIVISNSGINAVPVEVALACRERGQYVVAITNMDHTQAIKSRHPSGKKLFEVAHETIDNCGVYGDAELKLDGFAPKIGPSSTIGGVLIVQTVICQVIETMLSRGLTPPVFISANAEGGDSHNLALEERYRNRVRYL